MEIMILHTMDDFITVEGLVSWVNSDDLMFMSPPDKMLIYF